MGVFKDLTGVRFHRWVVIEQASHYQSPSGRLFVMWHCRCNCGTLKTLRTTALTSKSLSKSCGCYSVECLKERATTHSMSKSREYISYRAMVKRCYNSNDPAFYNYGERGITVCERWLNSFENFYEDMGERPDKTSIDRIDNNKGYSARNCRWATKKEQQLNRRNLGISKYRGVTWCNYYREYSVNVKTGQKYFLLEEEAAEAYDNYILINRLPNKINEVEDYPVGWFD